MGGDGGVIASNRKYMRGAGTADHTADQTNNNGSGSQQATAYERFTTCALTKAPLFSVADGGGGTIRRKVVACPYGRLYFYDAAVSALLRRKQQQQQQGQQQQQNSSSNTSDGSVVELESHIRGLKDLYEVRMEMTQPSSSSSSNNMKLVCPITDKELNGKIGAILLIPGNKNRPNVISEGAIQQLSTDDLNLEYGPIEKQIRLIPTYHMLHDIIQPQIQLEQEQDEITKLIKTKEKQEKKKNKKNKKRKHNTDKDDDEDDDGHSDKQEKGSTTTTTTTTKLHKICHSNNNNNNNHNNNNTNTNKITVASAARGRVASAVESNSVLSSLFVSSNASSTTSKSKNQISEKEKKR